MLGFLLACVASLADAPTANTVLVLPLVARNQVEPGTAELLTAMVAQELRRTGGFPVVTLRELEGTLTQDMQRQVAGCDSASCAAEIAASLNTSRIVMGELGNVGSTLVLSATLVEARTGKVLGSSVRRVRGADPAVALDEVAPLVQELLHGDRVPLGPASVGGGTDGQRGPAPRPKAKAEREAPAVHERFIALEERTVVTGNDRSVSTSRELAPVMGPYRKALSWPEFYEEVGHPEMASSFKLRVASRVALVAAGMVTVGLGSTVAVVGGLAAVGAALGVGWLFPLGASPQNRLGVVVAGSAGGAVLMVVGLLVAVLVGSGVMAGGFLLPPHPVAEDELRRLAEEHNAAL